MKIAFNPSTVASLTTPPNNKDITFDLRGRNIFARGVKFYGTDTNTWRDIKINNVSIGSHTLDLRNGSNTTLTNTNGVVTINSTWRPVVDNLTSDSTTSSLSAKQGKVLKALIDGKSNSNHNHDGRYVRYYAVTTLDCNNLAAGLTAARISATNAAHTNHSAYLHISDVGTPFQIQIPDSSIPYIYKRYYGSGGWSEWFKLNAGYADSAGHANSATNADMVDGYHENSFLRYRGVTYTDQEATLWSQIGIKQYNNALPDNLTGVYNYGSVISLPGSNSRFEIYASHYSSNGSGLYYRSGWNNDKKAWLKFIDSSNIGSQSVNYANSAGHANSAGNADTLGGIPRNYDQAPFGTIPSIGNDGVMEIGRYIDFHSDNSGSYDYSTRIQATGDYKNTVNLPSASGTLALTSYGGDDSTPIFLGYLNLDHGNDGTVSSSFYCLGYSVSFTYTRGGNYCRIYIPDTTRLSFFINAAIASVNYSGGGMDTWTGNHRGEGAWWLHCYVSGWNEVRVKGFCNGNAHNDSWWGGNPLYSNGGSANRITVCIFGHVRYK